MTDCNSTSLMMHMVLVFLGMVNVALATDVAEDLKVDFSYAFGLPHRMTVALPTRVTRRSWMCMPTTSGWAGRTAIS